MAKGLHSLYIGVAAGEITNLTVYLGTIVTDEETGDVETTRDDRPLQLGRSEIGAVTFKVGTKNMTGDEWLKSTNLFLKAAVGAEVQRRRDQRLAEKAAANVVPEPTPAASGRRGAAKKVK